MGRLRTAVIGVVVLGCRGGMGPCSPEDRAAIGANYEAEVALACPDHSKSLRDCAGYPAVAARYQKQREEFVACKK